MTYLNFPKLWGSLVKLSQGWWVWFLLLIFVRYKFKKAHSLTSVAVSHPFSWSQCWMQWCLCRSLLAWCSDWWSSSWWSLGLKLQDYCVPAGRRALPRPANQHIRHERRKPAWQTPTHRSGAGLHTENEDGELIKPANQPLTNIQLSDLYLQCSGDCWTFNDKIIIQPLKGHSVFKAEICSTHDRNNVSFMKPTF